ncbi:hypothetical protein D3C72_1229280 [compost metagenome]
MPVAPRSSGNGVPCRTASQVRCVASSMLAADLRHSRGLRRYKVVCTRRTDCRLSRSDRLAMRLVPDCSHSWLP